MLYPFELRARIGKSYSNRNRRDPKPRFAWSAMKNHPFPVLKINGNLRFKKDDVASWLARLPERKAA